MKIEYVVRTCLMLKSDNILVVLVPGQGTKLVVLVPGQGTKLVVLVPGQGTKLVVLVPGQGTKRKRTAVSIVFLCFG